MTDLFPGVDLEIQDVIRSFCEWHIAPVITEIVTIPGPVFTLPTLQLVEAGPALAEYPVGGWWTKDGVWHPGPRVTIELTHGYAECPPEIRGVVDRLKRSSKRPAGSSVRVGQVSIGGGGTTAVGFDPYVTAVLTRYKLPAKP